MYVCVCKYSMLLARFTAAVLQFEALRVTFVVSDVVIRALVRYSR